MLIQVKVIIEGVAVQNNNESRFSSIVPVILHLVMWLADHMTTSEGGTKADCQQTMHNCPNGGTMTYTVTTGWFGIDTSCTVMCY